MPPRFFFVLLPWLFIHPLCEDRKLIVKLLKYKIMDIDDIKRKLQIFATSEIVEQLKLYYSKTSSWEVANIARKEIRHTLFLNWFFNNKEFNDYACMKLIALLHIYAAQQETSHFSEELAESFLIRSLEILSCSSSAEVLFCDNNYGEGYLDLLITCNVKLNRDEEKKLNILIENKIDSPETKKKKGNKILYQTDAYYKHINKKYPNDINLFVFLKPITDYDLNNLTKPECKNEYYIQINYQQLLDCVIQPVLEKINPISNAYFLIEDYIRALGKPTETENQNDITIMAIQKKEKELLKKFFEQNEDLIRAAIDNIGDKELSAAMNKTPKAETRLYRIKNKGKATYTNVQVIEEYVKHELKQQKNIATINQEMNSFIYKSSSKRINVCDASDSVFREDLHHYQFEYEGNLYKVTKEWSDKKNSDNFWKLREGISAKYTDFQIEQVQ